MNEGVYRKVRQAHRREFKNRPLGKLPNGSVKNDSAALVEKALKSGTVKIEVCPPGSKKPDMRVRHQGY